jgi:tRNA dimethylallyltransferase
MRKVIIITGPTCCGKTFYSIKYAKKERVRIINCDSLQLYKDLKILTAFPIEYDLLNIDNTLFGYLASDERSTVYEWAKLAAIKIEDTFKKMETPVLVGGSGFFIKTLVDGLSPAPQIHPETRNQAISFAKSNYDALCNYVYDNDRSLEPIIKRSMHRQMIRAYEILIDTGKSVLHFHSANRAKFLKDVSYELNLITTDRLVLYDRINNRVDYMMKKGAIDEVQELLRCLEEKDQNIVTKYPIFNAIGAKEIMQYLNNGSTYETMIERIKQNTRHYAKRQITWLRHQISESDLLRINLLNH